MKLGSDDIHVGTQPRRVGLEHGLVAAMRKRTHALHARAERAGIVNEILRGRCSRFGYTLLLRNLLPAYQQIEDGLAAHAHSIVLGAIARPELYRAPALRADLERLAGDDWYRSLPVLAAAERYSQRVAVAAEGDGGRLIAHAYARYMGDLSGGQILKRLLGRSWQLEPEALSFYDFPDIADPDAFKVTYRAAIDDAEKDLDDVNDVVDEAALAFELNIALSDAVYEAASRHDAAEAGLAAAPP